MVAPVPMAMERNKLTDRTCPLACVSDQPTLSHNDFEERGCHQTPIALCPLQLHIRLVAGLKKRRVQVLSLSGGRKRATRVRTEVRRARSSPSSAVGSEVDGDARDLLAFG